MRVWLCIHNELADECVLCEDEDLFVNGAKAVVCGHEETGRDGRCLTCDEVPGEE